MLAFVDFTREMPGIETMKSARVRRGKFIHVRNEDNGKEYIVFSPWGLDGHHGGILKRFCNHIGLSGRWVVLQIRGRYRVNNSEWRVGGGFMAIDEIEKCLSLSGVSQAYGQPFRSHQELRTMLLNLPEFAGYTGSTEEG